MNAVTGLRKRLAKWISPAPVAATGQIMLVGAAGDMRSMPGQAMERVRYLYATGPRAEEYLVQYALNTWVYTAVSELATDFASAALEVWHRSNPRQAENHALLELLGPAGKPNSDDDLFEFLERHISNLLLTGQSFWYWHSDRGGPPNMVYNMPVEAMLVEPGASDQVGCYVYRWHGEDYKISKRSITHFKRYHPLSRYYGLSAMEALRLEIASDRSMAKWQNEFFGDDVFAPAGILTVDESTSDDERLRLEDELEGKHGARRRTMVMKTRPGSVNWVDAGLKQRDLDFVNGRLLSRQAVYEALGLPLGLYSESSTEAHARVAERLKLRNVFKLHERTAMKLNQDVLLFWAAANRYECRFQDVRQVDWQMEAQKRKAVDGIMTVNEIRERYYQLPALPGGDELAASAAPGFSSESETSHMPGRGQSPKEGDGDE